MTTTTTTRSHPAAPGTPADPGERGRLTVGDAAVERIAAHAATEVDGVGGSAYRLLGVAVGPEQAGADVRVGATVTGDAVALDVRLSVVYPMPVRRTADRVRAHLALRIRDLTGLTVTRVDVTVTALHHAARPEGRVW
ncbi:Asp23/Gls24 family envelope stress response protein [Actinosynnema mirum]|uniref:Asp23/Gls24 family envelope stress response protein n=1 Tax=Actinosynnema mirum (strain ATCC 29888 / DSM 43827 / JCM 3225 / NBRC 14064 / NCIMB 13271 / NRRL B-12336 / IMRU 3971 / 101) TaxID=446462 RepID=C6WP60_ACTMD|nr:Asp23/Gls24 family envelope stress response protein [Actinosynnema mirum]ACU36729.1 protein of unknown function DUF322 [Actinosynnema mirum DSM 43827]